MAGLRTIFRAMRLSFIQALRETTPEDPLRQHSPLISRTKSNVVVTPEKALTYSAVFAAMRAISQSLAIMGWHVMSLGPEGERTRVMSHPVDRLLDTTPNSEVPAPYFRESLVNYALTWGNGYAEIDRDLSDRAGALWQIAPWRVNPDRTRETNALVYDISNNGGANTVLSPRQIFHLRGPSFDGITGLSVIGLARQAIGIGLAAEEFQSEFFSEGLQAGGVVEHPGVLGATARENLAESLKEQAQRRGEVLVFEEGMKFHGLTIHPQDAQFLESRKFTVAEIARWFGVPLHMLEELDRGTFNNNEQRALEFASQTLVPWATRLEAEADAKLFGLNRQRLFTRLNVAALMRGDLKSRYDAYAVGRQWMFLSANDIMRHEGQSPLPPHIGDVYLQPANMVAVPLDPNQQVFSPGQSAPPPPNGSAVRPSPPVSGQHGVMPQAWAELFHEPFARIIRREQNRLNDFSPKARTDPGYLAHMEKLFEGQRTYAFRALSSPMHAALTIFGGGTLPETTRRTADHLLSLQIDGWCRARQTALESGIDPDQLPENLATLSAKLIDRLTDLVLEQWASLQGQQQNGTTQIGGVAS